MLYLGSYQLGDRLGLGVQSAVALAPSPPDDAPAATVYNANRQAVASYLIPPADVPAAYFAAAVHLDRRYHVGRYAILVTWVAASVSRSSAAVFDIVPGGDPAGAVIAGYAFHRPHAEYHVLDLDSGELVRGRNPFV